MSNFEFFIATARRRTRRTGRGALPDNSTALLQRLYLPAHVSQVEGRFLRRPRGELFVGAEITSKMQLGMLKKTLCNAILAFTRKMFVGVHYSFGDDEAGAAHELPHIVAPFVTSCDRMVRGAAAGGKAAAGRPPGEAAGALGPLSALPCPL